MELVLVEKMILLLVLWMISSSAILIHFCKMVRLYVLDYWIVCCSCIRDTSNYIRKIQIVTYRLFKYFWLCVQQKTFCNLICCIVSDLSKAMLRVSSWVVTTGADSLAATCSSLGCIAPRRPKPAAVLLQAPPFLRPGDSAVRDETHRVSQKTSCLSWSTSITSALESGRQEGERWE